MNRSTRLKITDLNPHLICVLCGGYLTDATTVIECLHSYCRSCIVRYLENNKFCPICDVVIHKTKPLTNLRSDKTLQDLVYKLVPGMYKNEMKRRRDYYANLPKNVAPARLGPSEDRGDEVGRIIYTEDENISLSLEFCAQELTPQEKAVSNPSKSDKPRDVRYLRCPAAVTVAHLKKYIRLKFDIPRRFQIDVFHTEDPMSDSLSLMDIAYIYTWRRKGPMRLFYTVYQFKNPAKRQKTVHNVTLSSQTETRVQESRETSQIIPSTSPVVLKTSESSHSTREQKSSEIAPIDKHRGKNIVQSNVVSNGIEKSCFQRKNAKNNEIPHTLLDNKAGNTKGLKMTNGNCTNNSIKRPEHSILVKDKVSKINGLNGISKASVHFRD